MQTTTILLLSAALLAGCASPREEEPETRSAELPDFDRFWNFSKPDATERRFRELLPLARTLNAKSYEIELLTQIARTQGLQRKFDDAHATLDEVERMLRDRDRARLRTRYLLERGRVFNTSGQRDKAKPLFVDAWNTGHEAGLDGLAVDAAHMVAIVTTGKESLRWHERALQLAERSSDEKAKRWQPTLLNNLGWTYHDLGRFDDALATFRKAVPLREKQGNIRATRIAKWAVGRCLRSLGRIDEALAIQMVLEREWSGDPNPSGYVFEEIGECYYAMGRKGESRDWFRKAWEILSKDSWLKGNEKDRLERLARLGGVVD